MLTKISLTHFKCFERLELDCSPLTLLCGINGMGKSSVIQALLVLRQSFETGDLSQGRLVLGGERVDIGEGSDVLYEGAESDEVGFALERTDTQERWELNFDCSTGSDLLEAVVPNANNSYSYVNDGWESVPPFGGELIYAGAERLGPRKLYLSSDASARRKEFGPRAEQAWNILNSNREVLLSEGDLRIGPSGNRGLFQVVDDWLQELCPGAHLQIDAVRDADSVLVGYAFDQPGDVRSRKYRATNVGFGLSYVLPIVVALLSSRGALCLIENPEAHLHPLGQTRLAELAVRASMHGIQVIAETHSDHFMDGVRIAVREGIISPMQVAFHYFERQGAKAAVTSPEIDEDGRLSHWPNGFFDQHELNLAKLVGQRSPNA